MPVAGLHNIFDNREQLLERISSSLHPSRIRKTNFADRDSEIDHTNPSFQSYEYNLSHTRSLARVSSATNKQYFQGSSLIRKKNDSTLQKETISSAEETLDQSFFKAKEYRANLLRNVDRIAKRKQLEDKGMSKRTKIKIKEKMMALYAANKNSFTLKTLTLIGDATDREAVQCLNKYLTALRKKYNQFNYVWVAEKQSNGRIHFHMICDRKFNIEHINSLWVLQQLNSGIDNEEARLQLELDWGLSFRKLHMAGKKGWKMVQQYLNPVDIAKIKTIEGVSAYLTNYVTKNETKMSCQIWHCNRGVSRLFTKQLISAEVFDKTCDARLNRLQNKRKNKIYINKTFVHQYGMINNIYNKKYFNRHLSEMNMINSWILNDKDYRIKSGVQMEYQYFKEILYSVDSETGLPLTASLKKYKTTKEIKDGFIPLEFRKPKQVSEISTTYQHSMN